MATVTTLMVFSKDVNFAGDLIELPGNLHWKKAFMYQYIVEILHAWNFPTATESFKILIQSSGNMVVPLKQDLSDLSMYVNIIVNVQVHEHHERQNKSAIALHNMLYLAVQT